MTGLRSDDRGVSAPVTHVLTIAITAVLLVGLFVGAQAFLTDERETGARDQLTTIGNRIAAELNRVDTLGRYGGDASIVTRHPAQVSGGGYSVSLVDASACGVAGADACLELTASGPDVTVRVPVRNETAVSIGRPDAGRFELSATSTRSATVGGRSGVGGGGRLSSRVGVGQGIRDEALSGSLVRRNVPPVARFRVRPTPPTTGSPVTLDATPSYDPDGNVTDYRWYVYNDSADDFDFVGQGETLGYGFEEPGRVRVRLQVVDDNAPTASGRTTRNVSVSGLEYGDDLAVGSRSDSVRFTAYNNWTSPVRLDALFLNPAEDSIDEIDEDESYGEVNVDVGDDGSGWDREIDFDDAIEVADGGTVVDLDQPPGADTEIRGGLPVVPAGTPVEIQIDGFPAGTEGEELRAGLSYTVDGTGAETTFDRTVGVGLLDYRVTPAGGSSVEVRVVATSELGTIDVDLSGAAGGGLSRSDFTHTTSGGVAVHTATVSVGSGGVVTAELIDAESVGGAPVQGTPPTGSALLASGDYVWSSAADWDGIVAERGVVHESFGDHAADEVELGYPSFDRGGSNLVGYWPMDADGGSYPLTDASGSGNNGATYGGVGADAGLFGTTAYDFDGYALGAVADSPELRGGDGAVLTVSAWFEAEEPVGDSDGAAIVGKEEDFSEGDWGIVVEDVCPGYSRVCTDEPAVGYYGEDDGRDYGLFHGEVSEDRWHHATMVLDEPDDELRLYYDGRLVAEDRGLPDDATGATGQYLEFGRTGYRGAYFDGRIDEVRIYDRALSGTEVGRLYNTSVRGSFTTDAKTGPSIAGADLELDYEVEMAPADAVNVTVVDGDGDRSDVVSLSDGAGTVSVDGLAGTSAEYSLEVDVTSGSRTSSPTVRSLRVGGS